MYRTAPFIRLGQLIDTVLAERPAILDELVRQARNDNPWFTGESVRLALKAISIQMLNRDKLDRWLSAYPSPERFSPKNVGIIMAGNIPLVGFFDLLCVCVSGHHAYVKVSSKERSLMDRTIQVLKYTDRSLIIEPLTADSSLDAVIATGSDNTNRYFRSLYGDIPHLLRGNRSSVAVLTGKETAGELNRLACDVFDYFGMGCRSVGKIFIPEGYDPAKLLDTLQKRDIAHPGYLNAYRHQKAILNMRGIDFADGGFFTLRRSLAFSEALPDIVYSSYETLDEVKEWIAFNDDTLQCIVTRAFAHPRRVNFGEAQMPGLQDYPDGQDVMAFLNGL